MIMLQINISLLYTICYLIEQLSKGLVILEIMLSKPSKETLLLRFMIKEFLYKNNFYI